MWTTNRRSTQISNLDHLRKLDVLDLHSNAIQHMEGLSSLQDLRVLNLAGNCLRCGHFNVSPAHRFGGGRALFIPHGACCIGGTKLCWSKRFAADVWLLLSFGTRRYLSKTMITYGVINRLPARVAVFLAFVARDHTCITPPHAVTVAELLHRLLFLSEVTRMSNSETTQHRFDFNRLRHKIYSRPRG